MTTEPNPPSTRSLEDFSVNHVPASATVPSIRLLLILAGGMIALPSLVVGGELGIGLGLRRTVIVAVLSGLVLALISVPAAIAGARSRLTTYMLIRAAFGTVGGRFLNALLSLSLLGWFGIIGSMFGEAIHASLSGPAAELPPNLWLVLGCAVMIATSLIGFRAINRLSLIITPLKFLLVGALAIAAWQLIRAGAVAVFSGHMSVGDGMTLQIGGVVTGAALQPTMCRFARSWRQAALISFTTFVVFEPLIITLAAFPAIVTGKADAVGNMLLLGLGIPALLTIIVTAWVTNALNLYSFSMSFKTILPASPRWIIVLIGGALGVLLGLLGISAHIQPYVAMLGVIIPPLAGVYLVNFYTTAPEDISKLIEPGRAFKPGAFAGWIAGVLTATVGAAHGFAPTSVVALNSLLASSVVALGWILATRALDRRRAQPA